jgi:hypothetical protein
MPRRQCRDRSVRPAPPWHYPGRAVRRPQSAVQLLHAHDLAADLAVDGGAPAAESHGIQERPGLRDAIEQAVLGPATAVVTLVVSGDGGTGKTQVAAATHSRAFDVDLRVWVSATSRAAILAAYAQVADAVRAVPVGDADARATAFLAWLTTTEKSWLVVLDDVAEPADVRGLWPAGRSGRVLVTTRRRDSAVAGRGRVIDVDVFIPAESSAYLSDRLTVVAGMPTKILDQASELAADLGHLPLALAQAAAVILDDGITCAAYRDLLADRTRTLNDLFPASGDDYERTLAGVWSLAAERADALAPVGLARPLLALSAVLDSNGIPERVLTSRASRTHLGGHAGVAGVEDARRALRNLHRLSLLTHDPDGEPRAVRMHALAQRATLEDLGEQRLAVVVHAAAEAILEIWPQVETDPGLEAALRANVAALAGRHPNALWKPKGHAVLFRAGHSLGQVGLVSAARDYFSELTRTAISHLGPDHRHTLTTRYNLAYWQGQTGDAAGARDAFEDLLADYLRVLGADDPDTLATRANLALWRGEAGDAAAASAAFEDLLADYLRFQSTDHAHTLTARAHVAYWRGRAGDAAGACAAFEELLRDDLRIRGPLHPETLVTRVNVARWRGEAGNAAAAYAAFQELITDYLQVLGPDHPDTLRARRGLGQWQGEAGDAAAAAAAFRELLTDYLRVLGPDHPDTLTARAHLARCRGQAGDAAGASAAFEDLLSDQLKVLGPDHPDTLASHRSLAGWREQAEREVLD